MCLDALHRDESCGGHFREESPDRRTARRLRDDDDFAYVAAWEFTGDRRRRPCCTRKPLDFEYVHPTPAELQQ